LWRRARVVVLLFLLRWASVHLGKVIRRSVPISKCCQQVIAPYLRRLIRWSEHKSRSFTTLKALDDRVLLSATILPLTTGTSLNRQDTTKVGSVPDPQRGRRIGRHFLCRASGFKRSARFTYRYGTRSSRTGLTFMASGTTPLNARTRICSQTVCILGREFYAILGFILRISSHFAQLLHYRAHPVRFSSWAEGV